MKKSSDKHTKNPVAYITVDGKSYNLIDIKPIGGRIKITALTIAEICKRLEMGVICREALLQRTENQWDNTRKSFLILSVLNERPIGSIIITGKGMTENQLYEKHSLLDGLQRTTSFLEFTRGKFRLSKNLPPVECTFKNEDGEIISRTIDISGLKFSQLPALFQQRILDTKIDVNIYNGFADDELDNIVFCVNNGVSFKPMQKIRTLFGSKVMKYIQPICDLIFWEKAPSIKAKNDNILGCIVRTLMLYIGYDFKNLSVSEMSAFAKEFKVTETNINYIKEVENLFIQLDKVVHNNIPDDDYSFLTPCTIPHFIMNLDKFNGIDDLKHSDYVDFINKFIKSDTDNQIFISDYRKFVSCCHGGSGGGMYSKEMAENRQNILDDALGDYEEYLKTHRTGIDR